MHPALSIVFFTTLSGAGYGALFILAALRATAPHALTPAALVAGVTLALLLVSAGLLSSLLHLGHPERAWRALSQWRTSWLSREGVLALAVYPPALVLAVGGALGWGEPVMIAFGVLTALLCAATVFATSMIYASLRPIDAWCNRWVPANYLLLALTSGLLLTVALLRVLGQQPALLTGAACASIAAAALAKLGYWRFVATTAPRSTLASAIGLPGARTVSVLQSAHTESNFLLQEMGFRIARKHARRLRRLTVVAAFLLPLLLSLPGVVRHDALATTCAMLAAASAGLGVLVERWLFFAEARHTVSLYYGVDVRRAPATA